VIDRSQDEEENELATRIHALVNASNIPSEFL